MSKCRVISFARPHQCGLLRHDEKLTLWEDGRPTGDHRREFAEPLQTREERIQLCTGHAEHTTIARIEATLRKITLGVRPVASNGVTRHQDDLGVRKQVPNEFDSFELDRAIARTLFADEASGPVRSSGGGKLPGKMPEIPFKRKVEMRGEILDLVGNDDDIGMLGERALEPRRSTFRRA